MNRYLKESHASFFKRIICIFPQKNHMYLSFSITKILILSKQITFPLTSHWFCWFVLKYEPDVLERIWKIHTCWFTELNHFLAVPQALILKLQMCVCTVCVCLTVNGNQVPLHLMKTQRSPRPRVPRHISTEEVFIRVTFQMFSYCKHVMFVVIYQMNSTMSWGHSESMLHITVFVTFQSKVKRSYDILKRLYF